MYNLNHRKAYSLDDGMLLLYRMPSVEEQDSAFHIAEVFVHLASETHAECHVQTCS